MNYLKRCITVLLVLALTAGMFTMSVSASPHFGAPQVIWHGEDYDITQQPYWHPDDVPLYLTGYSVNIWELIEALNEQEFVVFDFAESEIIWHGPDYDITAQPYWLPCDEPLFMVPPDSIMPFGTSDITITNVRISFANGCFDATNVNVGVRVNTFNAQILAVNNPAGAFNSAGWHFRNLGNHAWFPAAGHNARVTGAHGNAANRVNFDATVDVLLGSNHANAGTAVRRTGTGFTQ